MEPKRILVFCAVSEHIKRLEVLLPSLSMFDNDNIDIGIASFGAFDNNLPASRLADYRFKHKRLPNISCPFDLKDFADKHNFKFFYAFPQDFLPANRDWHCCELLGILAIARHFYDLGYDLVYECHVDIRFIDNFFPKLEPLMQGDWSFIAHGIRGLANNSTLQEKIFAIPSNKKANQQTRISQECIIFNRDFISAFYSKYPTEKIAWDLLFYKFSLFGDVALLDIARDFLGYKAILVPSFVEHGRHLAI